MLTWGRATTLFIEWLELVEREKEGNTQRRYQWCSLGPTLSFRRPSSRSVLLFSPWVADFGDFFKFLCWMMDCFPLRIEAKRPNLKGFSSPAVVTNQQNRLILLWSRLKFFNTVPLLSFHDAAHTLFLTISFPFPCSLFEKVDSKSFPQSACAFLIFFSISPAVFRSLRPYLLVFSI